MIKKIIGFLFLLTSLNLVAQRNNNSPYSYFGIGENATAKTVEEISMGGIGGASNSTYQLTFTNPASYGFLRLTNYALAGENRFMSINDGTNTDTGSNAALSYLALAFPVGQKAGFSFGLRPNTTVGYALRRDVRDTDNALTEATTFEGTGGTNSVYLGVGYKILNNLGVGLEASYLFGSIENTIYNRRNGAPLATLYKSDADTKGFSVKAGALYQAKVTDKLTLKSGITVDLSNEVSLKGEQYMITTENVPTPNVTQYKDTSSTVNRSFNYDLKNPLKTIVSAGVGQENKWYAGVEYEFQNALDFNDGITEASSIYNYKSSNRISVGGFYTPKFNSITSYWQRTTYRAGFKYEQTGLVVNNTDINDFGISFGVGLPMGKQLSRLNFGFEIGSRGEASNGLIKENYYSLRVGLSLSDKWFRKRKLD